MTLFNLQQMKNELSLLFRSNDVISTAIRGVTRTTLNYTVAAGGESTHTLALLPVHNLKTVTVNSVSKQYLRDYNFNETTGVVTWTTALVVSDAVSIVYDNGGSEKIYPDRPRDEISLSSMPRVGIEFTATSTQPFGLGGQNHISDFVITIFAWVSVNKDSAVSGGNGGLTDLSTLIDNIRNVLITNAKLLYTIPYIHPISISPIIPGTNNKIMQQSVDARIRFKVE